LYNEDVESNLIMHPSSLEHGLKNAEEKLQAEKRPATKRSIGKSVTKEEEAPDKKRPRMQKQPPAASTSITENAG